MLFSTDLAGELLLYYYFFICLFMGQFMTTDQKVLGLNPNAVTENQKLRRISEAFLFPLHKTCILFNWS
jgi:hypothetical protein